MIDYIDLYNNMENPLTDDVIRHLVECYSKNLNMHSYIINSREKQEQFNMVEEDELYEFLFKKWRKNVLDLSDGYTQILINNGVVHEDFKKLKDKLNIASEIRSKKEYLDLISKDKLLFKYGWHSIGNNSSWTHINSSLLSAWNESAFNIEHKLCLNCDTPYIEKIVLLLIKEISSRKLPFHIKFDTSGKRDDSIVIYSDTPHLEEYIQCIKKTRVYNKELFANIGEVPLFMGKIEPWLGYASETKDYKKMTFSEIRSNVLYSSIKSSFRKWVYENKYLKINSNGEEIFFIDFFTKCLTNLVISKHKNIYKNYVNENREHQFYEHYGLTKEELYSSKLKDKLTEKITSNILLMLSAYYNKELVPFVDVRTSNFKKITITNEDLKNTVKALSIQILNNYPDVMKLIKEDIEKQCKNHDIDVNKFCFDIKRREALFTYQKKVLNKKK